MFNLDPTKILIIVTVALVVLGPDKLPTALKTLGKYWNEFNRVRSRIRDEMNVALSTITDQITPVRGVVESALGEIKDPFNIVATAFTSETNRSPLGPSSEHAKKMFGSGDMTTTEVAKGLEEPTSATVNTSNYGNRVSPNVDIFWN